MENHLPKFLIFGGTGRTGRIIVRNLLKQGYPVSAFVRNMRKARKIKHHNYHVIHGNIHHFQDVYKAVQGHDIVISALGTSRVLPNTIVSKGVFNIVQAMKTCATKTLIFQSSLGVGDSRGQLGLIYNLILIPFLLWFIFKDKERQEKLITNSGLHWTIVRPAHFIPFSLPKPYRVMVWPQRPRILPIMSRFHTAEFMVKEGLNPKHDRNKVSLSYF